MVNDKAEMTSSSPEEVALGQAIMALLAGHQAEDAARALSICLALTVSHEHHESGHDLSMAELTLTRAAHLQRAVLRESWGRVEVERVQ